MLWSSDNESTGLRCSYGLPTVPLVRFYFQDLCNTLYNEYELLTSYNQADRNNKRFSAVFTQPSLKNVNVRY